MPWWGWLLLGVALGGAVIFILVMIWWIKLLTSIF